jgi:hypothetical protein
MVKNKILPTKESNNKEIMNYCQVNHLVERVCGFSLWSNDELEDMVLRIKKLSAYWEKKLSKVQPELVFIVTYYNYIGMSLNLACHRLGIHTIDIQHGVQGNYHVAYGRWYKVPSDGYQLLPYYFWVWSQDEKDVINRWSSSINKKHIPIVGGNNWINMWKDNENPIVKE